MGWRKVGRKEEGRMEEWKGGGWKSGRKKHNLTECATKRYKMRDEWVGGRLEEKKREGWMGWRKIAQSGMNVLRWCQDGWGRGKVMRDEWFGGRSTIKDECATIVSRWMG